MSENGIILFIYNKSDTAIKKDQYFNRTRNKEYEKGISDRKKVKRGKPNKKIQPH